MSAAEKLKVLLQDAAEQDDVELPADEIVAVVEQGQGVLREYDLWAEDANDGEFAIWSRDEFMVSFLHLRRALTALDEALT